MKALYNSATLAHDTDYSIVGLYVKYANGASINSYVLDPGSNHIKVSDIYPDAYIDNIGIHSFGELPGDCLYVSIVPGNEVNSKTLTNLRLLDTETGKLIYPNFPRIYDSKTYNSTPYESEDGRLVMAFYDPDHQDIYSNLSRYKLVLFESTETCTLSGTWTVDFKIDNMSNNYEYTPTATFNLDDNYSIAVDSIKLSNSYIEINGTTIATTEGARTKNPINLKLTLQDGTVLTIPSSWSGHYSTKLGGEYDMTNAFRSLINAEKVVGIELYGQYISLQ